MVQGVDYRVPMSVRGLDVTGAVNGYMAGQQNKRRNALLDLTTQEKEQRMQHLDDESRMKSIAGFAVKIKPFLDAGDSAGAQRVFNQRISEIKSRGGNPEDSLELAPFLMSGDLESAKGMVDSAIGAAQQQGYLKGGVPDELKVGRFRQITLPDGTMASLDTATNQMTTLAEAPSIDLSVLPEDMQEPVSKLPRELQKKAIEDYSTPKARTELEEKEKKNERAVQLANDTKRLISELLANEDGVRAAVGGFDESFFSPTFFDSTRDAEATLDDLKNLLTVENLDVISGILSDTDMGVIRSVGSNGLSGSDERVIGSLKRMAKALGINVGSEPQQNQPSRGRREVRRNPQTNYDETDINNLVNQYAD